MRYCIVFKRRLPDGVFNVRFSSRVTLSYTFIREVRMRKFAMTISATPARLSRIQAYTRARPPSSACPTQDSYVSLYLDLYCALPRFMLFENCPLLCFGEINGIRKCMVKKALSYVRRKRRRQQTKQKARIYYFRYMRASAEHNRVPFRIRSAFGLSCEFERQILAGGSGAAFSSARAFSR